MFTQKEGVQQFTLLETKQYGQFAELVLEKLTRPEQENDASVKKYDRNPLKTTRFYGYR